MKATKAQYFSFSVLLTHRTNSTASLFSSFTMALDALDTEDWKKTKQPQTRPQLKRTHFFSGLGEFCVMVKEKNQLKTINVQVMGRRFRAEQDNKKCSVT